MHITKCILVLGRWVDFISKNVNSIFMPIYSTLYKNCSSYISPISFKIGKGLAEIILCLCIKFVFLQIIGACAVAWTMSIELRVCLDKVVHTRSSHNRCMSFHSRDIEIER